MAKSGGFQTQTTTNGLDPATADWVRKVYGAAQMASKTPGLGVDPNSAQAGRFYGGAVAGGNLGLGALSGDPAARAALSNPYLKEVLARIEADQGRLNAGTLSAVGDQATRAGAFGGSRHGVAEGVALADVNRSAADRMAQLRAEGFNQTQANASQLANLGLGAAPNLFGYGDYQRSIREGNNPAMREASVLKNFLSGLPYGTTSQTQVPLEGFGWKDALGLVGTAAPWFMPGGIFGKAALSAVAPKAGSLFG